MNANRFRLYAEDCRRAAEKLPPDQQHKMLEMARAWEQCAQMIVDDEEKENGKTMKGSAPDQSGRGGINGGA